MANKPTKRCSTPLIIKNKQIKTAMKYHDKPIKIAKSKQAANQPIKKQNNNKNPDGMHY